MPRSLAFVSRGAVFLLAVAMIAAPAAEEPMLETSSESAAESAPESAPECVIVRPLLWRVDRKNGPPAYLFGTIHIPDQRFLNWPPAVESAFAQSDAIRTEVDLQPSAMASMQIGMTLPPGQTLSSQLSEDLAREWNAVLEAKGIPPAMFEIYKPWAAAAALASLDYAQKMLTTPPLDMWIFNRARQEDKEAAGLESVEEHMAVFEKRLSPEEQMEFFRLAIAEVKSGALSTDKLVALYLAGDAEAVGREIHANFERADSPLARKLRRIIIAERDERFADRIAALLEEHPDKRFFFAIGAGHLADEANVLERLRGKNLTLTRIERDGSPEAPSSRENRSDRPRTPAPYIKGNDFCYKPKR
jgi:uncharacterized protein YbaP (TraB family)